MKVPDILREQDFYAIQHLVTAVSSFRKKAIELLHWVLKRGKLYSKFLPIIIEWNKIMAGLLAYLDPGTGSMVLQFLVGGFLAIAIAAKIFWQRIVNLFKTGKKEDEGEKD
jgi:hypothetical protein